MYGLVKDVAELIIQHLETVEELKKQHADQLEQICKDHDIAPCCMCDRFVNECSSRHCQSCDEIVCEGCCVCTDTVCMKCVSRENGRCVICGDSNSYYGYIKLECGCEVCVYRGKTRMDFYPEYEFKCKHTQLKK